jgi:hypothetical protein
VSDLVGEEHTTRAALEVAQNNFEISGKNLFQNRRSTGDQQNEVSLL